MFFILKINLFSTKILKMSLKEHRTKILIFVLLAVLGAVSAYALKKFTFKSIESNSIGKITNLNTPLPEKNYFGFNNTNYNESLKTGRVLLVYILTSCPGCQKEAEIINQSGVGKNGKMKVFGISHDDRVAVEKFKREHKFDFPVIFDENQEFRSRFEVTIFPTNFVIDDGIIKKSWTGLPKSVEDLLDKSKTENTQTQY